MIINAKRNRKSQKPKEGKRERACRLTDEMMFLQRRCSQGVYHAQVVHEAGPVLPDLRRGAAERLHSDFLTAVQLPHRPHHHMHRVEHQR